MELRNLATFVRAAELHSFSQAAKQLGYSQSAISMQIGQLESELDTRLFDRVGKTIALTPQGRQFFEYAQNILRMTENARNVMRNASVVTGQLRIAMAESICMSLFPATLCEFRRMYPDVQLTVKSGTTEDMFRALAQNDVDIVYQLDNQIYRSDFVIPLCERVPIIFIAPAILGSLVMSLKDLLTGESVVDPASINWASTLIAMAVAAVSGFLAIKFMLKIIRRCPMRSFAIYTGILGIYVLLDQYFLHLLF